MKDLLYLKDDYLKEFIEKLFIGYRESFNDPKKILNKYSLGIAHHKAIHLISLHQGITISQLLGKLKVTKQSLNRVLKDLISLDAIQFKKGEKDTRLKHVFLTKKGDQKKRIYKALINSSSVEINSFNNVIKKIINE